jgi:hypothetical protein
MRKISPVDVIERVVESQIGAENLNRHPPWLDLTGPGEPADMIGGPECQRLNGHRRLTRPEVTKLEPSQTNRLGTSWAR